MTIETKTMTNEEKQLCLAETHKHVRKVQANLNLFVMSILNRGEHHDDSKFEDPELEIFASNMAQLAKVQYGSPEYEDMMRQTRPAIEHHYSKNRHHPEFHKNGIDDMTLVDLVEMLADWTAATERNKNGNIRKSIEMNADRFNITPQLRRILENTVKELFNK